MKSWIGHALLSDNDSDFCRAAYLVASMLCQVAFQSLKEASLIRFGKATHSAWDTLLYAPIENAPMAYYSAWNSAHIDPSASIAMKQVALRLLEHAKSRIRAQRHQYRDDGDIDKLLHLATSTIADALIELASLIGHCDARSEPIFGDSVDDEALLKELTDSGLLDWIGLYSRDLRRGFAARGSWSRLEDLTSLGVHMERHLWQHAIFPWISAEDQIRIEVP
jgi:hypothetical protein